MQNHKKNQRPYFVVTIDVEADNVWADPANLSTSNLSLLPDFQMLCDKYDVMPTYLLSYETLCDTSFVAWLKETLKKKRCEAGIHPHIWTIPPFKEEKDGIDVSMLRHYQSAIEVDILKKKLNTLHHKFIDCFGIIPTAHRAGRWGLCNRTVNWLEDNHYITDTSVVPYKAFPDTTLPDLGHPDFYRASPYPYQMSHQDITVAGDLKLIEVPVTNINKYLQRSLVYLGDQLRTRRGGTRLFRLLRRGGLYPLEFRPYPHYQPGALPTIAKIALNREHPVLNLMFHSSELMKGGSPYSSTEEQTNRIWSHVEEIFAFIKLKNIPSLGLSDTVTRLKENSYFS